MSLDPRGLRPSELCRLLNSTPLGEVIADRQLHRHRTRAGYRIVSAGNDKAVDLFRYAAWLAGGETQGCSATTFAANKTPHGVVHEDNSATILAVAFIRAVVPIVID